MMDKGREGEMEGGRERERERAKGRPEKSYDILYETLFNKN